jgi:spoIIIJ-associated protein
MSAFIPGTLEMDFVEFTGKNTEEAINNAASALKVPPEHLEFTIISTGSKGFWGLGSQNARILVDTVKSRVPHAEDILKTSKDAFLEAEINSSPRTEHLPPVSKPEPVEEDFGVLQCSQKEESQISALFLHWKPDGFEASDFHTLQSLVFAKAKIILPQPITRPLFPEEFPDENLSEAGLKAKTTLAEILSCMGFSAEITARFYRKLILLDIQSLDNALIIGRRGVGLDSLELLLNSIIKNKFSLATQFKLVVDAEDYRARRHLNIIQKTFVLANQANLTGKIQGIPQLTFGERQLVRHVVAQLQGLSIKTIGGGALRNIQIIPNSESSSKNINK